MVPCIHSIMSYWLSHGICDARMFNCFVYICTNMLDLFYNMLYNNFVVAEIGSHSKKKSSIQYPMRPRSLWEACWLKIELTDQLQTRSANWLYRVQGWPANKVHDRFGYFSVNTYMFSYGSIKYKPCIRLTLFSYWGMNDRNLRS